MGPHEETVTFLLKAIREGDCTALDRLLPILYDELHRLARRYMRSERKDHTLQPTALLNEAYIRLTKNALDLDNRAQFLAFAACVMRNVLVDHARKHLAAVRGGGQQKLQIDQEPGYSDQQPIDLLALADALSRLEKINARQAKVVEMRFFGGLSMDEIAGILGITSRSVKRDWAAARLWLHKEISKSTEVFHPKSSAAISQ